MVKATPVRPHLPSTTPSVSIPRSALGSGLLKGSMDTDRCCWRRIPVILWFLARSSGVSGARTLVGPRVPGSSNPSFVDEKNEL